MIYISKGAKIILTANLNPELGLYNGAIGTIIDILFYNKDLDNYHKKKPINLMGCMPDCIIVKFDSYKGLVSASDSESKCVAIKPIKTNWKVYGEPCSRI